MHPIELTLCDNLIGHKILVFDVETTGLPKRNCYNRCYRYDKLSHYDNSRIVQIAWYYTDKYDPEIEIDRQEIKCFIRKPTDFGADVFNKGAVETHHITYERALNEGILFRTIMMDHGLVRALKNCDIVISHNNEFDINILLSELCRAKCSGILSHLKHTPKQQIDTMKLGVDVCRIIRKNSEDYKYPTLNELYHYFHGIDAIDQHDAGGDVMTLLECIKLWTHKITTK